MHEKFLSDNVKNHNLLLYKIFLVDFNNKRSDQYGSVRKA